MKKLITTLLCLVLTAITHCYSQTPQLIVFGNDTFGVVPAALETNINRTYNAAHKFRDLYYIQSQASDSLREALVAKSAALNDCDQAKVDNAKIAGLKDLQIQGLKKENHRLQRQVVLWSAVSLVEGVALWVAVFKR